MDQFGTAVMTALRRELGRHTDWHEDPFLFWIPSDPNIDGVTLWQHHCDGQFQNELYLENAPNPYGRLSWLADNSGSFPQISPGATLAVAGVGYVTETSRAGADPRLAAAARRFLARAGDGRIEMRAVYAIDTGGTFYECSQDRAGGETRCRVETLPQRRAARNRRSAELDSLWEEFPD